MKRTLRVAVGVVLTTALTQAFAPRVSRTMMVNRLTEGLSRGDLLQNMGAATFLGLPVAAGVRVRADENVIARRPLVPERIFDTKRLSYIPVDADRLVHNKALDQRAVCIGEVHTDNLHHKAQIEIIKAMHERSKRAGDQLVVGMEMFYRQHQPICDEYIFGSGTLASLKEDVHWDKTWGHKLSYYSKILQFCKLNGIRVVGLNVPLPVIQVVRKMGLENVPKQLSQFLPDVDLDNRLHRESFMRKMAMFGSVHGGISQEAMLRLYEAQSLWDEYMAESASRVLQEKPGNNRIVVVAGNGHIENRFGVPERITKRTGTQVFTVVPVTVSWDDVGLPKISQPYSSEFADWVWYVGLNKDMPSGFGAAPLVV